MLNMIRADGYNTPSVLLFTLLIFAGVGLIIVEISRRSKKEK